MHRNRSCLRPLSALFCLTLAFPAGSAIPEAGAVGSSDKGDFQYAMANPWPETKLDLGPIQREIGQAASTRCGTGLAAAPMDFGKAPGFMGKMAGKLVSAGLSQLVGGFLGGGGSKSQDKGPPLKKDPIRSKFKSKFTDEASGTQLEVGGKMFSDALLLSADIDKSKSKGTFHTIFLEKSDCTRIFPEDTWGFRRWGKWSLSVSITRTTRTYQNGNLVNESVSKSGWSKSGTFDYSNMVRILSVNPDTQEFELLTDPNQAFLNKLKSDLETPLWQQMGYEEPTQGLRSVGAAFPGLTAADIGDDTIAVVHITQVKKGRYQTVGFPMKLNVQADGSVQLKEIQKAF